jgi:hypothetical protein
MEGYCLTGQSPQRAVVPVEEEEYIKAHEMSCLYKERNYDFTNIVLPQLYTECCTVIVKNTNLVSSPFTDIVFGDWH